MSKIPKATSEADVPRDDPTWHETFERPNELKDKVGPGPVLDAKTLAEIESVMDEFKEKYVSQLEDDVSDLEAYFQVMSRGGTFDPKQFWSMVHDIRGEAGSLGYPLISEIGTSLCELLAGAEDFSDRDLQAVELHLSAMRTIVTRNIVGDGGSVGRQVTEALQNMVAHLMQQYRDAAAAEDSAAAS